MKSKDDSESKTNELLTELEIIKSRINDYDWEYRFSRFQERLTNEKNELAKIMKEIKTSN